MLFWMIVKVAFKSLMANKLRTILAMLGIIIGVAAVIAMLAIGAGAQEWVLKRISAMGTNVLVVRPGQRGTGGVMSGTQQNLTVENALDLLTIPGVHAIAPAVNRGQQIKFMNQNTNCNVLGTTPTYLSIRDFQVEHGKMFTEGDIDHWNRVAVIGPVTASHLFGFSDPVDQIIKVKGINFRVLGVLKSKGDQGWFNPDDQVIIPYTTAMHSIQGVTKLSEIDIEVVDGTDVDQLQKDILAEMRRLHKIEAGAPDDVQIQNQAEFIETFNLVARVFTLFLGCVAGISLLVGGIGIMNIMLVTVTERTREIGIRKAIGARDFDILSQFLIESVLLTGLGGVTGMAIGIAVAALAKALSPIPAHVKPFSVILSLAFSAGVGIFFGFYPAIRAARLDPIEALRYE